MEISFIPKYQQDKNLPRPKKTLGWQKKHGQSGNEVLLILRLITKSMIYEAVYLFFCKMKTFKVLAQFH